MRHIRQAAGFYFVSAALFMVRVMTMLRTEISNQRPLSVAIGAFNASLSETNSQCMFVTLAVVVINRHTGVFHYASAGHSPAVLGASGKNYRFIPTPGGIFAGIDEHAKFEAAELTLENVYVLYFDGLTEAMNGEGEFFTERRLLKCLDLAPVASSHALSDHINAKMEDFAGGAAQTDDLTLVVVRYHGL